MSSFHWADSAKDKLIYQKIDNLHELSKPVFWEKQENSENLCPLPIKNHQKWSGQKVPKLQCEKKKNNARIMSNIHAHLQTM